MRSFIKDLSNIGLSKLLIIVFGIGRGIITARWLGPDANGTIAALAVYPSLFITFGALGVSQSATHFVGKGQFSEESIKTSISQIWMATAFLSTLISYFLIRFYSNSGENLLWIFLAIAPIPFSLFNKYNLGIFLGKNDIGSYTKISWLPPCIVFFFTVLLVVAFPFDVSGALCAAIGGPAFIFFVIILKNDFTKCIRFEFNWKIIRSLVSLGVVYATALLVINLNYKLDIILLDKLSTPFELGIYAKGVVITDYLWQIPMLLSTIVFARSSRAKNAIEFSRKVSQLLRLSIIFVGIGSVVLAFSARYIILIMYGNEFIKSAEVLLRLLPGVLLLTIFKVMNMDLAGKGKPWISMKAMIPSLLLNVVLNCILIPNHGANGAAISSAVSYTIAAVSFLYFYSEEVHLSIREILSYSRDDFLQIKNAFKLVVYP